MRVTVTKDYLDGSQSKSREIDLDSGISMNQFIFMLTEQGVAGLTITRVLPLLKMTKDLRKEG